MNKKILMISIPLVIAFIIAVIMFYIWNQPKDLTTDSIVDNSYYVEKGQEKYAKLIKGAVESYTSQNITESSTKRKDRLGKYFTTDSPVFGRAPDNISSAINKSDSIVTSIIFKSLGGEGMDNFFVVITKTTFYSNKTSYKVNQTYWVSTSTENGKLLAYDIGSYVQ